jgi:hypothetical protein
MYDLDMACEEGTTRLLVMGAAPSKLNSKVNTKVNSAESAMLQQKPQSLRNR